MTPTPDDPAYKNTMTQPTQAQIKAELKRHGCTSSDGLWVNAPLQDVAAALTAAAGVGEQYVPKDDPRLNEIVGPSKNSTRPKWLGMHIHEWSEWDQPITSKFGTTRLWYWERKCRICGKIDGMQYG